MRAPRRNEEGVSRLDREPREALLDTAVVQRPAKSFRGDVGLQPKSKRSAGPGRDGVPHFRLTEAPGRSFVPLGVSVVRMNLHGKIFFGEDELYEKRNARTRLQPKTLPCRGKAGPAFPEGAAGQWTRGKSTLIAREPNLADGIGSGRGAVEQRRQAPGAPNARHKRGRQPRRRNVHGATAADAKKRSSRRNPSSIRSIEVA